MLEHMRRTQSIQRVIDARKRVDASLVAALRRLESTQKRGEPSFLRTRTTEELWRTLFTMFGRWPSSVNLLVALIS
jgi:hypothetical protein